MSKANLSLSSSEANSLLAFAIAGAGFKNFQRFVGGWNDDHIVQLATLFDKWKGNRSLSSFYRFIFEDNGYRCEDVPYFRLQPDANKNA